MTANNESERLMAPDGVLYDAVTLEPTHVVLRGDDEFGVTQDVPSDSDIQSGDGWLYGPDGERCRVQDGQVYGEEYVVGTQQQRANVIFHGEVLGDKGSLVMSWSGGDVSDRLADTVEAFTVGGGRSSPSMSAEGSNTTQSPRKELPAKHTSEYKAKSYQRSKRIVLYVAGFALTPIIVPEVVTTTVSSAVGSRSNFYDWSAVPIVNRFMSDSDAPFDMPPFGGGE